MFLLRSVFFAWEATWGKALTTDQLKKRGWSLPIRCYLCGAAEETVDHLLIHCTKARVLWELLFNLFGVMWVLPSSGKEILLGWYGAFVGKKRVKVWRAAPLCLFWTVWKERNRVVFENDDFSIQRLKFSFVCNLWSWFKLYIAEIPNSLINFFEWLGYRWGRVSFLYPSFFCFTCLLYTSCMLWVSRWVPCFY